MVAHFQWSTGKLCQALWSHSNWAGKVSLPYHQKLLAGLHCMGFYKLLCTVAAAVAAEYDDADDDGDAVDTVEGDNDV